MENAPFPLEISVSEAHRLLATAPAGTLLLDVREPYEVAICGIAGARLIPMRQIPENIAELPRDRHILVCCHAGMRSLRVTQYLRAQGFSAVSNVAGGMEAWAVEIEPGMTRY